ncbi:TROVE domain-containing protein [Streptomyces sp. WAC 05977]|nr:TROVE domain-containing protein [Streptomyces sp. WAC 05977]
MSKFNTTSTRPATTSPINTARVPTTNTYEGASGHERDTRSELFLLAVSNFVGENTFYETGDQRDTRYADLVRETALADPEWTARFLRWLRTEANMRTAAIVGAAEYVHARLAAATTRPAGTHETSDAAGRWEGDNLSYVATTANRAVIDSVLQRPDEPGEMLAYWTSLYGKKIPKPVKRGIADAAVRLFHERSYLKWDSDARGFRFADVLGLVHPDPKDPTQDELFKHILDVRFNPGREIPAELGVLAVRAELMAWDKEKRRDLFRRPELDTARSVLRQAGMTWESLAGWLQGPMDARAWEAVIPSMGYMALLRNLRNFDEAGVSDEVADEVIARLTDPDEVARSKQFPFRFWAAYKHTHSLRWGRALETALKLSLGNVPALGGRTLVLVDRSPSMFPGAYYSTPSKGDITLAEQAAVFGAAVAMRAADATLVEFGGTSQKLNLTKGGSVLRLIESFGQNSGTDIPSAVKQHYANHDRVIVITDEQTRPGYLPSNMGGYGGMEETSIDALVPLNVPVYMWNMAGYKPGAMPSGTQARHTFGGLTDQAFRMIPLLEAGRSADWPF